MRRSRRQAQGCNDTRHTVDDARGQQSDLRSFVQRRLLWGSSSTLRSSGASQSLPRVLLETPHILLQASLHAPRPSIGMRDRAEGHILHAAPESEAASREYSLKVLLFQFVQPDTSLQIGECAMVE